ncbi:hypothetical protein D3Z36_09305 [Lachnospiraceae bacterium]|nr:hypothetical protein [Lachnospiraceae bacterium]
MLKQLIRQVKTTAARKLNTCSGFASVAGESSRMLHPVKRISLSVRMVMVSSFLCAGKSSEKMIL